MALSFLSQNSGLLDLQTIFDPQHSLQQQQELHLQHQQRPSTKIDFSILNDFDQMEYNNSSNRNHNQYQNHHTNNNNNNNHNNIHTHQPSRGNINQIQNRHYMSGYHHQHTGSDYEQVINFVDSPPNSEESWTDTQSKDSPGPQIIDVQTIYSNSGSRKRRMDWDSLDIGQSENSPPTQSGELPNKVSHQEKDKHKREKQSGRSSWSDDIGFDLNAEFNSNSYLNNESFLTFSPGLTALKQEPQSEQLKTPNSSNSKSPLAHAKIDKSSLSDTTTQRGIQAEGKISGKHELNGNGSGAGGNFRGCGSPQGSPTAQDYELNSTTASMAPEKTSGGGNNTVDVYARNNGAVLQQLSVVDAAKIENLSSASGTSAHAEDHKFQYILAAATSIATKNNEETLTYLNQGQSYEIKLKKIGDLSFYRDKILKSVIKICFHERRLQFMEREQMQQWQASRPGERIIEVDVPLSYGLCHVSQPLNPNSLNTVEIFWDPLKEVGVYIKVNCISTEFTPKKHGGEKGVPFRLQIETYIENTSNNNNNNTNNSSNNNINNNNTTSSSPSVAAGAVGTATAAAAQSPGTPGNRTPNGTIGGAGSSSSTNSSSSNSNSNGNGCGGGGILNAATALAATLNGKQAVHAAACQIKVFKLKGADRKHKQDREKIQKRPQSEQEKFQPSYECTIMNDIALDLIVPNAVCYSPEYMKIWPNSPVHIPKYDGILPFTSASPANSNSPIAINSVTSTNSPTLKLMDATNMVSPQHVAADIDDYTLNIMPESTPAQVTQWLTNHRLTAYLTTFAHFSGADILRMSKEDLIQICGLADGIRMFNILRAKTITPRLTLYVSFDGNSYNAVYLITNTAKELTQKLFKLPGFYETVAKSANSAMENGVGGIYNGWGMHSKYSGSGSNIFNDVNKSFIYVSGPSGVHVTVTDEVLNNEIKDGSLYALEVQNGKVVLKLINKSEN